MKLVDAKNIDMDRLVQYYRSQSVNGHLKLSFQRPFDFFNKYRLQSDDFKCYVLVDKNTDDIHGMASLIFRDAVLNEVPQKIAYATDLRVSPTRRAILRWAPLFMNKFYEEADKRDCRFTFSVIERYEGQTYNALIRPQHSRRKLPRYNLFRRLYAVGIHGKWPWCKTPIKSVYVEMGSADQIDEIARYLQSKQTGKLIYFPMSPDILFDRLKSWPGSSPSGFLVARDRYKNIVGCLNVWNPDLVENSFVESYQGKTISFYQTLQFLNILKMAKTLAQPSQKLQFSHLTHIAVDNPDIFHLLLYYAFDFAGPERFLLYGTYKGDYITRPPFGFIHSQIPYGLFTILKPDQTLPDYLKANPWSPPPEFEFAVV